MTIIEIIGIVLGWVGAIIGFIRANLYAKRAKIAEISSQEITTADQMINLVKKANAEVLEINRKENKKLRKSISKLEKAVRAISNCPHRSKCPVVDQLQGDTFIDIEPTEATN